MGDHCQPRFSADTTIPRPGQTPDRLHRLKARDLLVHFRRKWAQEERTGHEQLRRAKIPPFLEPTPPEGGPRSFSQTTSRSSPRKQASALASCVRSTSGPCCAGPWQLQHLRHLRLCRRHDAVASSRSGRSRFPSRFCCFRWGARLRPHLRLSRLDLGFLDFPPKRCWS